MHHGNLLPWLQLATAPLGPWQPTTYHYRYRQFFRFPSFTLSLSPLSSFSLSVVYLLKPLPPPSHRLPLLPHSLSEVFYCGVDFRSCFPLSLIGLISVLYRGSVCAERAAEHTHRPVCLCVCVCMFLKLRLSTSAQAGARRCVFFWVCAPHAGARAAHNYRSFRLMLPMFDYSDQGPSYGD